MERENKLKMSCTTSQLAEILRSMADAMADGRLSLENLEVGWNEVDKITLSIRNAAGMADVKMKISSCGKSVDVVEDLEDGDDVETTLQGKPLGSYDSLKKRMKKSFKNIMYALHDNVWPSELDIDSFVQDSAQMVLYPGKGDEFYPAYSEAVAVFADAVNKRDLDGAYQAAHQLNSLKTQCHKKYD